MIETMIIGDIDIRGRYLPSCLYGLSLREFKDFIGRSPTSEQIEIIELAHKDEHGEEYDPESVPNMGIWDAAWEVLEELEGFEIQHKGDFLEIARNENGDVILVNSTEVEEVKHKTGEYCEDCLEQYEELDESEKYWLGYDEALIEDECHHCGLFATLTPAKDPE